MVLFCGRLVVFLADPLSHGGCQIRSILHDFCLSWRELLAHLVPWVGEVSEMLLGIDQVIQLVLQPLAPLPQGLVVPL